MIVSGFLRKRNEKYTKLWTTIVAYARPIFHATMARDRFFHILVSVVSMTKLQVIKEDHPTNWLQTEMYLKA